MSRRLDQLRQHRQPRLPSSGLVRADHWLRNTSTPRQLRLRQPRALAGLTKPTSRVTNHDAGRCAAGGARADGLSQRDKEALLAAVRVLRSEGPTLGRPLVDTIVGSRHANMKELRLEWSVGQIRGQRRLPSPTAATPLRAPPEASEAGRPNG